MPGGVPVWPGKPPNPGGRPKGDAVQGVSTGQFEQLQRGSLPP